MTEGRGGGWLQRQIDHLQVFYEPEFFTRMASSVFGVTTVGAYFYRTAFPVRRKQG
jgi:hypothetical protein